MAFSSQRKEVYTSDHFRLEKESLEHPTGRCTGTTQQIWNEISNGQLRTIPTLSQILHLHEHISWLPTRKTKVHESHHPSDASDDCFQFMQCCDFLDLGHIHNTARAELANLLVHCEDPKWVGSVVRWLGSCLVSWMVGWLMLAGWLILADRTFPLSLNLFLPSCAWWALRHINSLELPLDMWCQTRTSQAWAKSAFHTLTMARAIIGTCHWLSSWPCSFSDMNMLQ